MREVYFATTNPHKYREAELFLRERGIKAKWLRSKPPEIQSEDLAEIARRGMEDLAQTRNLPTILEDAGLFVDALKGFPGPYSAYIYKTLGCQGILRLLGEGGNRKAVFLAVVAFREPGGRSRVFKGRCLGRIAPAMRGEGGFGFDPIFLPRGVEKTFAQMDGEEKNRYSHRARALAQFAEWFLKREGG